MPMPEPWTTASAPLGGDGGSVTLVEESAFCISARSGDMLPGHPHGLFFRDTRFLSGLRLRVNDQWPEPLEATTTDPFSGAFVLRDPPRPGRPDSHLMVFRRRYVGRGMREDIALHNFGEEPAVCTIELLVACDFADLFDVKGGRVENTGDLAHENDGSRLTFTYRRGDFRRATWLDFSEPPRIGEDLVSYEVIVMPRGEWSTCIQVTPVIPHEEIKPRYRCGRPVERSTPVARLEAWRRRLPITTTDHDAFRAVLERSTEDLAALRIFDPDHPDRVVVAAGAPWFMTVFGRDSLITSWMAMMIDSDIALGTLKTLEHFQGKEVNPLTEEEPGRILHEMRFGDAARLSLGGGRIYYGTVDATPLFVMLLGELGRWGTKRDEVDALLPAADRALEWIRRYGDRDGDGYVEYQRTTDRGLRNQGWKDSGDSTRFADGTLAEPPIALCEVQGYVYAALVARSHFATEAGDLELAASLGAEAAGLKEAFNRDFWLDEHGWYAMGLDRDKRPIDALTSNMGHCLWTGIVDEERAPLVAEKLMSDACFSGWGVRTLGATMVGFNPISYHTGSVWPHDNAIVAAGLMRYGLIEASHRIMEGMVAAAGHFGSRLPELFSGLSRSEFAFPVGYPTSCSPQAWAAAAPLLFLRTMLRFEPDIRNAKLHLAPAIPEWIGRLRLERIELMGGHLSIEVEADQLTAMEVPDGLTIVGEPRRATT